MKIITWNVNSIRAREARLLALLERHKPDVLCLQELKVADDAFPTDKIYAAGYRSAIHGQKTYNGVAILSRTEITSVERTLLDDVDDPQSRLIAATVDGVRVLSAYVPNGSEVGSDKWQYKLAWYERLSRYLTAHCQSDQPLVLCGDFNVAPTDLDVAKPKAWKDTVLCAQPARDALAKVLSWGLIDTFRLHQKDGGHYSWWDYRSMGFRKNDGLRIDFVFATAPLAAKCVSASIDRDERTGEGPSDHAPVIATFER